MPEYSLLLSYLEKDLLDLQRRMRELSDREDALCDRLPEIDDAPDAMEERPSALDDMDDAISPSHGDLPCDPSATTPDADDDRLRPNCTDIVIHEDSESPVPYGCHRVIKTYDNGIPIAWADVPDGQPDPEPMYLCTEAARIYMMSDEEYAEYERMQQRALQNDLPLTSDQDVSDMTRNTRFANFPRWAWTTPSPSVKVAATALLMLPCLWIALVIACLVLWPSYPAFFVMTGILLLATTSWSLTTIMRYPKLTEPGSPSRHPREETSPQGLPNSQGSDIDGACSLLSEHVGHAHVGTLAEDGLRQIDATVTERKQVMALIDEIFSSGSLSWVRFADTVDGTCDAIGQNVTAMADDVRAYDELRFHEEAARHLPMSRMRDEQRQAGDALITSMRQHVQNNEALLLELDKLRQELLRLKGDKNSESTTAALEEIQRLVAETPEYR